jgi:Leucine-rich repeat (LRR) protein
MKPLRSLGFIAIAVMISIFMLYKLIPLEFSYTRKSAANDPLLKKFVYDRNSDGHPPEWVLQFSAEDRPPEFGNGAILAGIDDIGVLELSGAWVIDDDLMAISKMSGIKEIYLNHTSIGNVGLTYLSSLKSIDILTLNNSLISESGLAVLQAFSKLRELSIYGCKLSDSGLAYIGNITSLQSVLLSSADIRDLEISKLARLPNLRELHIRESPMLTGNGMEAFLQLEVLQLSGTSLNDESMVRLRQLHKLRYLDLSGSAIKGPGLRNLAELPNLSTLILHHCPLTDEALVQLAACKSLRTLGMRLEPPPTATVTYEGVVTLVEALPQLEELHMWFMQYDWDYKGLMARFPKVKFYP